MSMTNEHSTLIREAGHVHAGAMACIYNYYITDTVVTFEVDPLSPAQMSRRLDAVQTEALPWLVAERDGQVVGYAYADRWHARFAYRHSVESTVYVAPPHTHQGIGSALYEHLLAVLRCGDYHTAIGGIALPNDASVALHEKFGFRQAAHYSEVGFKFQRWIDVGYWQLLL